MRPNVDLATLPVAVWVILGVVLIAELALLVVAVVDLVRRPRERVTFGNKWVWAAIIVLVNLIGPILYLAIGRQPAPATAAQQQPTAPAERTTMSAVADALYGKRDDQDAHDRKDPG